MEKSRGKKAKKAGWHLTLKVKDAVFAGIGIAGLMMISFALGVLAGRGDIYRAAYSWGLMRPVGPNLAQWAPPASLPVAAPGATTKMAAAGAPVPRGTAAMKTPSKPAAPVTGSIARLPATTATQAVSHKKKGKTASKRRDHKTREEELRKVRREVVQKLRFQNSFDSGPKPRLSRSKTHEKAQAKSRSTRVRVGQYRSHKAAAAKVAELHKKGVKASLKKTRDAKGVLYLVYQTPKPTPPAPEKLARKSKKRSGASHKPKVD